MHVEQNTRHPSLGRSRSKQISSLRNCGSRPALQSKMWTILRRQTKRPKSRKLSEKRPRRDMKTARNGIPNYLERYKVAQEGQKKARRIWTGSLMQTCSQPGTLQCAILTRTAEMEKLPKKKSNRSWHSHLFCRVKLQRCLRHR